VGAATGGGYGASSENPEAVVKSDREKIGRNNPCWCGSGKKHKTSVVRFVLVLRGAGEADRSRPG
jgi:hypothetical protein